MIQKSLFILVAEDLYIYLFLCLSLKITMMLLLSVIIHLVAQKVAIGVISFWNIHYIRSLVVTRLYVLS